MIRSPLIADEYVTWAALSAANTTKQITIERPNPVAPLYAIDVLNYMGVSDLTVKLHDTEPDSGINAASERALITQMAIPKTPLLLIENCEDAWSDATGGHVTCDTDGTIKKVGTNSAKMTVAGTASAGLLAYENISAINLSPYTHVRLWIYSTIAVTAGQLQLVLSTTANCADIVETLNIPAMSLNTWYQFWLGLQSPTACTSIASVGIRQSADLGAFVLYIDDVNAAYLVWHRTRVAGAFLGGDLQVSLSNDTAFSAAEPGPFKAYVRVRGIE